MASSTAAPKRPSKKRQGSASNDDESTSTGPVSAEPIPELSDTLAAISFLRALLPERKSPSSPIPAMPKIVMVSMVYGVLTVEPTAVDSEIDKLAKENRIRRLRLGTGTSEAQGNDAVMLMDDYWNWVEARWKTLGLEDEANLVLDRFRSFLSTTHAVELDRRTILDGLPCRDDDITLLVTAGLLTLPSRHGVVRVAVPGAAAFSSNLARGRTELLQLLRRRKFHEMLEQLVAKKGIRTSVLPYKLHVCELVGCGWVTTVKHPGGNVAIRCTAKGLAKISTAAERAEKKRGFRALT